MKKQRTLSNIFYLTALFTLMVLSLIGGVKPASAQTGGTGFLEICKAAQGEGLQGRTFFFRVQSSSGIVVRSASVGGCSGLLEVPAGNVTIEELTEGTLTGGGTFSGRFRLLRVASSVEGSLGAINLLERTAVVNVRQGSFDNKTVVTFTNTFAVNAVIEICKRAAPNETLTAAGFFNFTVDVIPNRTFSIPVNGCSGPIEVNVPTSASAVPVRADVTVTELGRAGFALQSATVTSLSILPVIPFNEFVRGRGIRNTPDCMDERRDPTTNAVLPNFTLPAECFFVNPGGGTVSAFVQEGGTASQTTFNFFNGVRRTAFDYDGDARADVSVYRFSTNRWYERLSSNSVTAEQTFGLPGDIITPADFDGDGKTDIAIFRPSTGTWWYLSSLSNVQRAVRWGRAGDIPLPGDFDGDGRADFIVFRPTNRTWYRLSSSGQTSITEFGLSIDTPVIGDFDGDGKTDLAVYRTSTGTWWYLESTTGNVKSIKFGLQLDLPVPADYDGDGKTDIAVYRHSAGTWYINNSGSNTVTIQKFGISTDQPVAADYDGDGRADLAVYRPSEGMWYLLRSSEGFTTVRLGILSDIPTPAAYNYSIIIID